MNMKKNRLFTLVVALLMTSIGFARDIHGVNGFYNWTPSQFQAAKNIAISSGTVFNPAWISKVSYGTNYIDVQLGVNSKTYNGGFPWRTTVRVQDFGDGTMTITKNYPVVAFKFSMPNNNLTTGQSNDDIQMFVEHWWYNPYTGTRGLMSNVSGLGLAGFASNGRYSYIYRYPYKICNNPANLNFGRDSVKLGGMNALTEHKISSNGVLWSSRQANTGTIVTSDTSMVFMRLPSSSNEKAEYIVLLNYYSIADTSYLAGSSKRILDRMNLKISDYYINFFARRDTLYSKYDTTFATDGSVQKIDTTKLPIAQNMIPSCNIKWMKTFTSIQDAWSNINSENAWGDGVESAQKSALNYGLYYAEVLLNGYCWRNSDPNVPDDKAYLAYKAAYDEANAVYNNSGATDQQYTQANTLLQAAKETFLAAADLKPGMLYNYLKSGTGSGSIVIGASDVTVGTTIGKPLTFGSNAAAVALSFSPTGNTVSGQRMYRMGTPTAGVVQASDGTLLLVTGKQGAGSVFSFGQRDVEGNGYDIKCGDYYYYMDTNGALAKTKTVPYDKDIFDVVSPYLFNIVDALAEYKSKISVEEKADLFAGWEFNSPAVDDPSTHGFVTDTLGNAVEKFMFEFNDTKMVDGWRMSRWRAYTRVNKVDLPVSEGTASCLALSGAGVYDNWDGSQAGIVNDMSAGPAMRYDFGKQSPFYARDPNPRDSSHVINLNAGYTRYMAMKWKGTNSNISLLRLNYLLGTGVDGLVISAANATGVKGDIMYWDMLQCGAVVGKQLYTSAFFNTAGFASFDDKMYIDWIRMFDSVDLIPNETMTLINGVKKNLNPFPLSVFVNGRVISVYGGEGVLYNMMGTMVSKVSNASHVTVSPGVYLVKAESGVQKVIVR
jgi:hypothetical protein